MAVCQVGFEEMEQAVIRKMFLSKRAFTGHSSIVLERSQYGGSNVGYGKHVTVNQKKQSQLH